MKYLKLFDTKINYLAYRDSSDYLKPNVSLSDDNGDVYYNFTPPPIVYETVDLGLPSGTKWASQNVGARKPSDVGLYFQWGDVQGFTAEQVGKDKMFTWDDYKWSINGSYSNFSKYENPYNTLETEEDDAAYVNMGGDWHMPSPTQIQELLDNTTNAWITQDGVNGRLFTSKSDPYKSIFIPAAGYAADGSFHVSGDNGYVLSSMLSRYNSNGQVLHFDSSNVCLDYAYLRSRGISVRGVIG